MIQVAHAVFADLLVHRGQVVEHFVRFRSDGDLLESALALRIGQLLDNFPHYGKFLRVLIEEL